jgi:hypothetical protein
MSKETKKDTEQSDATQEDTQETASEESTEETTEETKEKSSSTTEDTDYEALDNQEKARVGKPDPIKAREAFKKRKEADEDEEVEEEDDEKPLTRREMKELLSGLQKQSQESEALKIARAHTASEAEAKAAVTFWKTRVNPTGNLEEDVLFAIGGLNHKKVVSTNAELIRALKSKNSASTDVASSHRDPMEGTSPRMSASDQAAYKRAGFSFDTKDKVYKKKLPSGKTLIKDPKTKKSYVV